jgi:hypothetical protein
MMAMMAAGSTPPCIMPGADVGASAGPLTRPDAAKGEQHDGRMNSIADFRQFVTPSRAGGCQTVPHHLRGTADGKRSSDLIRVSRAEYRTQSWRPSPDHGLPCFCEMDPIIVVEPGPPSVQTE